MDLTIDDSELQLEQEPDESAELDTELEDLQAQIKHLDDRQQALQSHLLSISAAREPAPSTTTAAPALPEDLSPLISAASAHSLTNLHRLCAGCTAFHVQDPNPNALDSGRVLGIRLDVCLRGSFIAPYYILLNRVSSSSQDLRIYKHTLPPCIPLAGLAEKWLALPPRVGADGIQKPAARKQDLARLVREVRREVVGYHRRLEAVEAVREALEMGANSGTTANQERSSYGLSKLEIADAEAHMLRIEWEDGRIGRVRIDKDGEMQKVVVVGDDGRMRELEMTLMGREDQRDLALLPDRLRSVSTEE